MNKRYMDFVPTKATKASKEATVARSAKPIKSDSAVKQTAKPARMVKPARRPASDDRDELLGIVEEVDLEERIVTDKPVDRPVEKPVEKSAKTSSKTFNVPKNPFINQAKVEKRPLSKNVYQNKISVPKEEPKGPVTIIAKPEKDTRVRLIIAVILTIILGAAAGTVAFLLLPK